MQNFKIVLVYETEILLPQIFSLLEVILGCHGTSPAFGVNVFFMHINITS